MAEKCKFQNEFYCLVPLHTYNPAFDNSLGLTLNRLTLCILTNISLTFCLLTIKSLTSFRVTKKISHGKFSIFYRKPLSSWLEEAIILNIKTLWTTPTLKESVWPLASVRLIWLEWAIPWPPISLRSVSFMDVLPYIMLTKWCSSYNILVKICEKNVWSSIWLISHKNFVLHLHTYNKLKKNKKQKRIFEKKTSWN